MYCQKCHTPLKLHNTVSSLNPASFNLLVDSTPIPTGPTIPSRPSCTADQAQTYNDAVQNAQKSSTNPSSAPPSPSPSRSAHTTGAMSFINITDSQVVPPAIAHAHTPQTPPRKNRTSWSSRRQSNNSVKNNTSASRDSSLSQKMQTSTALFEILSSRTDIDHPVCTECTDTLISGMEKRLANATKERDAYVDFLRQAHADMPTAEEAENTAAQLAAIREQEASALAELEDVEKEKAALEDELRALESESAALDEEEKVFWAERNAVDAQVRTLQEEESSLTLRLAHDEDLLRQLRRVNVYNDAFHISHAGEHGAFATINGLRLGRTSREPVDWPEINAAWGQLCLLLATVADKLHFVFDGHVLKPMGSTSSIDQIKSSSMSTSSSSPSPAPNPHTKTSKVTYPLYYASDLPLPLQFHHRPFSDGMVAFADCVRQLGAHVAAQSPPRSAETGTGTGTAQSLPSNETRPAQGSGSPQLHYTIQNDKLWHRHDRDKSQCCSIRLGRDYDEWTRACKFLATNCKILLAVALWEEEEEGQQQK